MNNRVASPKLRFPEFTNEWHELLLGDLFTFKNGFNADKSRYGSGTKYISVSDIIDNRYITKENIKGSVAVNGDEIKKNLVSFGDVLFQRSSETREEVGQVNIYIGSQPVIFGGFVIRGHAKLQYEPYFMNYLLRTPSVRKEITNRSGGSTRYNIGQDSLEKVSVFTTSLDEQQKIADFLTIVDDKIASINEKIKFLKQYKKGVMQKIFTQQIRFKDENDTHYPDWKEKALSEIGKIVTGKTPSTTDRSAWIGDVLFVTPTDIIEGSKYQETTTRTVNSGRSNILPKKSIMYTCIASIGKMALSTIPSITNQQINSIIPSSRYNNEFIYYELLWLTPRIRATQSSNTLPIINKSEFSKLRLAIPIYEEQLKIADFLISIDSKIKVVESRLAAAKKFKSVLLQRMFV
jgi:type I restriction enzyme S subunit